MYRTVHRTVGALVATGSPRYGRLARQLVTYSTPRTKLCSLSQRIDFDHYVRTLDHRLQMRMQLVARTVCMYVRANVLLLPVRIYVSLRSCIELPSTTHYTGTVVDY